MNLKPVGEAAIKDGQDEGRRVPRKSTTASDEDEEEMRMDEDEPAPSQPNPSQQRGKKKTVTTDADEDEDRDEVPKRSQKTTSRRSARTR